MEDEDLVRAEAGEGRTPFTLTDAGKTYVEEKRAVAGANEESRASGWGDVCAGARAGGHRLLADARH